MKKINNRFSLTVFRKDNHEVAFDIEYYISNLPDDAIDFAKQMIDKYNNFTNEIWLFDNNLCCNVAKVYKNENDNNVYVKCYATL